jgi:hypothetical protein
VFLYGELFTADVLCEGAVVDCHFGGSELRFLGGVEVGVFQLLIEVFCLLEILVFGDEEDA